MMYKETSSIILAGGKSSRMGFDKSAMIINNEILIQKTIRNLEILFENVLISIDTKDKMCNFDCNNFVVDEVHEVGPLSGILSALEFTKSKSIFVISCDMPCIDLNYINFMMKHLEGKSIVVSQKDSRIEPFPGLYTQDLIPAIKHMIYSNSYSLTELIKQSNAKIISEDERKYNGFNDKMFINLNTVDDIKKYINDRIV